MVWWSLTLDFMEKCLATQPERELEPHGKGFFMTFEEV